MGMQCGIKKYSCAHLFWFEEVSTEKSHSYKNDGKIDPKISDEIISKDPRSQ